MTKRQLLGLRWYHWVAVVVLIASAVLRNPDASVAFVIGTAIGAIAVVAVLAGIWRAIGEFRKGLAGETTD